MTDDCPRFREAIQDRLDGPIEAGRARALDDHLRRCADCREAAEGLAFLHEGFRDLPSPPMPEEVHRAILARTVDAAGRRSRLWPSIAAAAVLLAAAAGLLWTGPWRPSGPTPAETARAEEEARYVLAVASAALRRGERAVVRDVLRDEIAPAVRRIPLRWNQESGAPDASRRNGT